MSAKHSEAMRKRWRDPAYRQARLTAMSAPGFVADRIAGTKAHWRDRTSPHHMLGTEKPGTRHRELRPTLRDIGWAAGFLEDEGSFYQSGGALRRRAGTSYITAYQVNKEPVYRLLRLFGGSLHQRAARAPNQHPVWVWRVSGSRARGIAMTMFALMSTKRQEQIKDALNCGR